MSRDELAELINQVEESVPCYQVEYDTLRILSTNVKVIDVLVENKLDYTVYEEWIEVKIEYSPRVALDALRESIPKEYFAYFTWFGENYSLQDLNKVDTMVGEDNVVCVICPDSTVIKAVQANIGNIPYTRVGPIVKFRFHRLGMLYKELDSVSERSEYREMEDTYVGFLNALGVEDTKDMRNYYYMRG